jgi:hypothetical protein
MLYTSRSVVVPGETLLAWSPEGRLHQGNWQLGGATLSPVPFVGRGSTWWDHGYFEAVTIPVDAESGPAVLACGRETVEIEIRDAEGVDGKKLAVGRTPGGGMFRQVMPVDFADFSGMSVSGPASGIELLRWSHGGTATNVTIFDCQFRNVVLTGGRLPGLLVSNCTFDNCSLRTLVGPALFYRCRFRGMAPALLPEFQVTGSGVACVDCTWEDVGNGISFQTTYGPITGSFVCGAVFRGMNLARNGSDGVAVEGAHEFSNNLILHTRYEGEGHVFNLWKVAGTRNTFREYLGRGGMGVQTVPPDHSPDGLKDNCFCGGELVGTTQVSKAGELELSPAAIMQYWDRPAWAPGAEPEQTLWVDRSLRGNLW